MTSVPALALGTETNPSANAPNAATINFFFMSRVPNSFAD
jgi:hypothetical protein